MFSKVRGRSALAKLCAQTPIPFNGIEQFVFSMDSEASIVGEGEAKPAASATATPKVIRPLKFVYQARVSDEFLRASDEARIPTLQTFADGFSKKIARGFDIAAFHGINPANPANYASFKATNSFDGLCTGNDVTYVAASVDDNIDAAIANVQADDGIVTGIAMSPAAGAAMSQIKVNGVVQYPEFRFGQNPDAFYGMGVDVNATVAAKKTGDTATDAVIVGDFQNAFKWGYAANIPLEIIQYGDPDGRGRDLKQYNEVCLRAEAFIGWGILDADSFARVVG
jgi:HK97 family phage major capsid protein